MHAPILPDARTDGCAVPSAVRKITTLDEAAKEFAAHGTPRLLAAGLVLVGGYRVAGDSWGWTDLLVAVALVGLQPFTEWAVHVFVLHCPADGSRRDQLVGYAHRRHHEDPRDLRWQFLHPTGTAVGLGLFALLMLLARSSHVVSGVLTAVALTAWCEWLHLLIHTDHAPRSGVYRRIHQAHRLHHFCNEQYWLGVTSRLGDKVLGTNPDKTEIEVSPTARTALATR